MSKLKMFFLLFVLLSPAFAFADCADGKYKDCRCSLAVNNGFGNVSDVTVAYCCEKGCGGMGFNGDSRCCIGAEQGKTWNGSSCVSAKTPCESSCPSGMRRTSVQYEEDGQCCTYCNADRTIISATVICNVFGTASAECICANGNQKQCVGKLYAGGADEVKCIQSGYYSEYCRCSNYTTYWYGGSPNWQDYACIGMPAKCTAYGTNG